MTVLLSEARCIWSLPGQPRTAWCWGRPYRTHSNEITAIPELPRALELKGCLERRKCWVITDTDELAYVGSRREWATLSAVARVSYRRNADAGSPTDARYHICSYQAGAPTLLTAARSTGASRKPALGVGCSLRRGSQSGQNGSCRPEPGGHTTPGPQPPQAGTHRQSRHQSQTQKGGWYFDYLLKVLFQ